MCVPGDKGWDWFPSRAVHATRWCSVPPCATPLSGVGCTSCTGTNWWMQLPKYVAAVPTGAWSRRAAALSMWAHWQDAADCVPSLSARVAAQPCMRASPPPAACASCELLLPPARCCSALDAEAAGTAADHTKQLTARTQGGVLLSAGSPTCMSQVTTVYYVCSALRGGRWVRRIRRVHRVQMCQWTRLFADRGRDGMVRLNIGASQAWVHVLRFSLPVRVSAAH